MNKHFLKITVIIFCCLSNLAYAAKIQSIKIAYITQEKQVPPALSNLDTFIQLKGLAGAEIAISDNNTTGSFTAQKFELIKVIVPSNGDVALALQQQIKDDIAFVVTNLSIEPLTRLLELDQARGKLFFDASTTDDSLRNEQCRDNVLHLLPSRAMRADALAQYMAKKRWRKWFLVSGMSKQDQLYAAAIKRAANRFGMSLVAEKQWTHTYDVRRTAQSDVPVFTQGIEYDVLVVADEQGLFGEYFSYRTWIPRPVAGTQGLVPTAWHRTHEQWGAVQIQNRFKKKTGRWMTEQDYGAYLAVRAIGEAAIRTHSNQMQPIKDYLLGDEFALQGYKGNPLSFRPWNGQLRQPVLLAAARSLVAVAPIEGFLHPVTELDTLGYDKAESACNKHVEKAVQQLGKAADKSTQQNSTLQQLIQRIKHKLKQLDLI